MFNKKNNETIQLLKETIQMNPKKIAVLVGAGASTPLGIKNWKDLLIEFGKKFNADIDVEESIKTHGYAETASKIYKIVNNHENYLKFLSEQFEPKSCSYTSTHAKIIDNFPTILTTNFDVAFENAFNYKDKIKGKGNGFNIQKFPKFEHFLLFEKPTIVYLHGNNEERKYIFRKEEYDSYYPSVSEMNGSNELEDFLKTIFTELNLIFIGFSFDDAYFTAFLEKILKEETIKEKNIHEKMFQQGHPRKPVDHFVIIDDSSSVNEIEKMGLNVILYKKGKHTEIDNIIDKIMPTEAGNIEETAYGR